MAVDRTTRSEEDERERAASADWASSASIAALCDRGEALRLTRDFFAARSVLEVQTPLLGSASVTDPNIAALAVPACDSFLQTSTEYHQKRLLAAGVGDNYTLGPVFRAHELGRLHNPEFIMLEWYRLGFNDVQLRQEVGELVDLLLGPAPYEICGYSELLEGVSLSAAEKRDLPAASHADLRVARALEALGPGRRFVVDYPADEAVLARLSEQNPEVALRFELVVDGVELANGYFELTDPATHQERFQTDMQRRAEQGLPGVTPDQKFLAAIDFGLPSCAGVALGFDRLLQLRQGASALSDVQAFGWERR